MNVDSENYVELTNGISIIDYEVDEDCRVSFLNINLCGSKQVDNVVDLNIMDIDNVNIE